MHVRPLGAPWVCSVALKEGPPGLQDLGGAIPMLLPMRMYTDTSCRQLMSQAASIRVLLPWPPHPLSLHQSTLNVAGGEGGRDHNIFCIPFCRPQVMSLCPSGCKNDNRRWSMKRFELAMFYDEGVGACCLLRLSTLPTAA